MPHASPPLLPPPHPHTIRLFLIPMIVACVLGIVSTYLASFACSMFTDTNPSGGGAISVQVTSPSGTWRLEKYEQHLMTRLVWYHQPGQTAWNRPGVTPESIIPVWSTVSSQPLPQQQQARMIVVFEDAAGWPFLSATCRSTWDTAQGSAPKPDGSGIAVADRRGVQNLVSRMRALPLVPMWPGFAINTLLWAAVWFGLLIFCGIGRRSRRVRRGLCGLCGFDLRGGPHAACPECGSQIGHMLR